MNTNRLATILISLSCMTLLSQERAVTDSGKTVLIYPDGTWKDAKTNTAGTGKNGITRPKVSIGKAAILKGRATIFYNPKKWKPKGDEEGGRTSFVHADGDAQAIVLTERIQMPIENLEKVAIDNAKLAAPDTVITHRETKRVNGLDIVAIQMKGTIQGTRFCYYNYYYSCEKGVIQILTFTSQNLFNEYKPDFEDFLNGLTLESSN